MKSATLALGTGITTAVFSLVDTVLIKPLPYPQADDLVTIYESTPVSREPTSLVSPAHIEDWHRLNHTFVTIRTTGGRAVPQRLRADARPRADFRPARGGDQRPGRGGDQRTLLDASIPA